MDGQSFITINPDTLADSTLWSYRDLQKVSKALGLKANGQRDSIVERLQSWNRLRLDGGTTVVEDRHHMKLTSKSKLKTTENLEMNVDGFNFSILAIHVKEKSISRHAVNSIHSTSNSKNAKIKKSHQTQKRKHTRHSIIGFLNKEDGNSSKHDAPGTISPSFLRPLRAEPATPGKSCLKQVSRYSSAPFPHPHQNSQQQQSGSKKTSPTRSKPVVRSPLADLDLNVTNNSNNNIHPQLHGNSIPFVDTDKCFKSLSPTRIRDITLINTNNNTLLASPAKEQHLLKLALPPESPLRTSVPAAISASAAKTTTTTDANSSASNAAVMPMSATKRFPNICFSPFNGVRIIAHREEEEEEEEVECCF